MGFLQSVKSLGKAPPMTPETLMAMYPELFQDAGAPATPAPPAPVAPAPYTGGELPPVDVPQPPLYPGNVEGQRIPEGQMPAEYQTLPTTGPEMTPEPAAVNASAPLESGPSQPVNASNAPAKRKGLMGFLGDVGGAVGSLIAPEPGSFMDQAYEHTVFGAKRGMQDYQRAQAASNLATQEAAIKLKNLRTSGEYKVVGNNVFHIKPDGQTEILSAPAQPGETERLISLWEVTADPAKRKLIEQAIKGYQWSPWVLDQLRKTRVAGAAATANAKPKEGTIPDGYTLEY